MDAECRVLLAREGVLDTTAPQHTTERKGKELIAVCAVKKKFLFFPFFFIAVKKSFQGKGVGTKIAEKFFAKYRFRVLFLTTLNKHDVKADRLYAKLGFRKLFDLDENRDLRVRFNLFGKKSRL